MVETECGNSTKKIIENLAKPLKELLVWHCGIRPVQDSQGRCHSTLPEPQKDEPHFSKIREKIKTKELSGSDETNV